MVKKMIRGDQLRPRLSVYRSLKHIYAQIIDDEKQHTLLTVSTLDKELRKELTSKGKVAVAKKIGEELAKRALKIGITKVVFHCQNRGYYGRIKAVAEGARLGGLII
jgi:large subunit ribosomal protein L18